MATRRFFKRYISTFFLVRISSKNLFFKIKKIGSYNFFQKSISYTFYDSLNVCTVLKKLTEANTRKMDKYFAFCACKNPHFGFLACKNPHFDFHAGQLSTRIEIQMSNQN